MADVTISGLPDLAPAAKHAVKKAAGKEENAAIAISLQKAGKSLVNLFCLVT